MLSRKIFLCRLAPPFPRPLPPGGDKSEGKVSEEQPGREREKAGGVDRRTFSSSGHVVC
jgi:hypothetical protein